MRRHASFASVALLVFLSACSRSAEVESEPAPSFDPVGIYDFSASMGGMTRTGQIQVTRTNGVYGGLATLQDEPDPAIVEAVRLIGNVVHIEVTPPNDETVQFELTMSGSTFTGNVVTPHGTIPVTGTKH